MDAIPVLSQLKSLVQAIAGQKIQAKQTQENFSRQCPIVSQTRSFVEWIAGDPKAAEKTQLEFLHFLINVTNGIPVAGHIKGVVHYAVGDKEKGDLAMKCASHTTAVIAGGVGGMIVFGPVGAYVGGAASGAAMDGTITAVDSAIKKKPSGFGAFEPVNNPRDAGKWVDSIGGIATDALLGRMAGGAATKVLNVNGAKGPTLPPAEGHVPKVATPGVIAKAMTIYKLVITFKEKGLYMLKNENVQRFIKFIFQNKNHDVSSSHSLGETSDTCNQEIANNGEKERVELTNHAMRVSVHSNGKTIEISVNSKLTFSATNESLHEVADSGLNLLEMNTLYTVEEDGKVQRIDTEDGAEINAYIDSQENEADIVNLDGVSKTYI